MVIFNRSHYEDVLVVRVLDLVPEEVWRRRYEHIRVRADARRQGHHIVKLFLHISKDEQKERLAGAPRRPGQALEVRARRLDERAVGRLHRGLRGRDQRDLHREAPWYVVPADRNWYRNLVVSQLLIDRLGAPRHELPRADASASRTSTSRTETA